MDTVDDSKQRRKRAVFALQGVIGNQVVSIARLEGMSQADIIRALSLLGVKMHKTSLCRLKSSKHERQMSLYTLLALCEVVGCEIEVRVKKKG